jgi:hypothetical protein
MAHPPSDAHPTHGLTRRGLIQGTALTALTGGALFAATTPAQASRLVIGPGLEEGVMPPTESRIITPMSPTEASWNEIDGVPTMYIRDGTGVRKPATFRSTFGFYATCETWVRDALRPLSAEQGYPGLSFITSAGAYVNKAGQHGAGTAVDIDEVGWTDGRISRMIGQDWRSGDSATRKRYYAVGATLRAHFHWVLDHTYNTAHHDHFHADFGSMPPRLLTGSSSDVGAIQRILNEFQGAGLAEDDIWGPLTNGAFQTSRQRLGTTAGNPHTETASYRAWLYAVARKGFAGVGW